VRFAPLPTTLNGETPCGGSVYTVFGGLTAVILTDVAQSIIMLIGCVVILYAGLQAVGGIEALQATVRDTGAGGDKWDGS
jgi:Na+/pantothenate symporter